MIDEALSRDIEVGAIARPRYSTDVITVDSGFEVRNQRWLYPLFSFEFNIEPGNRQNMLDLGEFIDLWHAAAGQFDTFLFQDWGDYEGVNEPIGTGDGAETEFQLYRVYSKGAITRLRKITRPVAGTVTVRVNGSPTAVTVDYSTGIVTFGAPPSNGAAITADFQFRIPVRFADDQLELVALSGRLDKPMTVQLVQVRE